MKNTYHLRIKEEKAVKENFRIYSIFFAITSIIIILFGTGLKAQVNFTHVTDQPVLSIGAPGEWDAGAVWAPAVIKDGDTLRMWYTGCAEPPHITNPPVVQHIGYAWSVDGIEWHRDSGNPVLSGELSWEAGTVMNCAVIKDGDIFKMWYGANNYAPGIIGYATSVDGKNWSKHSVPVLEIGLPDWDKTVLFPNTVIKEGSLYKMYYSGGTGWGKAPTNIIQIGMATSTDGINWVKYNDPSTTAPPFLYSDPVLKPGVAGEWEDGWVFVPIVLPTETGYEMWYSGSKLINAPFWLGYATSSDGISWTKYALNPILDNPTWGTWEGGCSVQKFDEQYHLWYNCFFTSGLVRPQIGYATSPIITNIESAENEGQNPTQYHLLQNYPNPFNPSTTIKYSIPQSSNVVIKVFDILGRQIETLVNEEKPVGTYELTWNAANLPSGVYFYKLQAGSFVETKKMILLK